MMTFSKTEIMNDVEEIIYHLGLSREDLDELYNSQHIDVEDSTLDAFIINHEWMFLSSKGVYIQKEELEYSDYSEESKNVVIFLAD
jgi:hypothetical protein